MGMSACETAPAPAAILDLEKGGAITQTERQLAAERTDLLHTRFEHLLEKERHRKMRPSNPQAQIPAEVRAARRLDRQHPDLSPADRRLLAIAAKDGDSRARNLLLHAEPTLCRVTAREREQAAACTARLYGRYRYRLSAEQRQGPRGRDEEMLYPAEIRAATWLDGQHQYLQKEDQRLLAIAAKLGDGRASTLLLMSNQHAAIKLAKRVTRKDSSLHDMVQSTNLGLLHAIQLYDPTNEKEASFLTFASWHGWQRAMRDGQLSGRTGLSVPPYMDQICDLVRKVRLQLITSEQRSEHGIDELLALVNEGRSVRNLIEREELERAVQLLEVAYQPLDSGWADEEDGRSFSEQIGVDETEQVIASIDYSERTKRLRMWLQELLGDSYELYVRNQGLFGHEAESVTELAEATQRSDRPLSRNQVALKIRSAKKLVEAKAESAAVMIG
jgi:DNA-directed RNA polymerase sigma subunit (sigma70/sigma32)